MHRVRRSAAIVLAGAALSACSADRSVSPLEPTAPSASRTLPGGAAALAEQERLERERIRQARVEGVAAFKALQDAAKARLQAGAPALACGPQRYDAQVRVVGPAGGELRAGPHTLVIPAGALQVPTVVTMEAPVSDAPQVRLSPQGLTFDVPPTLTMSYRHCDAAADQPKAITDVHDDDLSADEPLPVTDVRRGDVVADIEYLSQYVITTGKRSNYAVAW